MVNYYDYNNYNPVRDQTTIQIIHITENQKVAKTSSAMCPIMNP